MSQQLLAPVGTKTYVTSKEKYIIIQTSNKLIMDRLYYLENGRESRKQKPRPELFAFNIGRSNVKILKFNKFTLSIVAKMIKAYPDEVMVFVGSNYWFSELPQEIQEFSEFGGTNTQLINKIEKENENEN